MIYTLHDFRYGGVERLVLSEGRQRLMRLPDILLGCVFYVCVQDIDGTIRLGGTGFFISIPFKENPDTGAIYAVTARHVIEKAREYPKILLRLNDQAGGTLMAEATSAHWVFPDDPAIDLAVLPWAPPAAAVDYKHIARSVFADEATLNREAIGIGDDLAIIGLFQMHHGTRRNRPIARLGHIAAMPDEPLLDDSGLEYRAFLAEIRSIGGLSGSPVFVLLEPGRVDPKRMITLERKVFLLGLVRGHWDQKRQPSDFIMGESESVNVGIAIVTPVTDLLALLDSGELAASRTKADRDLTRKRAPTPD